MNGLGGQMGITLAKLQLLQGGCPGWTQPTVPGRSWHSWQTQPDPIMPHPLLAFVHVPPCRPDPPQCGLQVGHPGPSLTEEPGLPLFWCFIDSIPLDKPQLRGFCLQTQLLPNITGPSKRWTTRKGTLSYLSEKNQKASKIPRVTVHFSQFWIRSAWSRNPKRTLSQNSLCIHQMDSSATEAHIQL